MPPTAPAAPVRVLHFADVHIGMENYGRTDPESGLSTRVRDFLRRMDEMIGFARDNEVDLTVFAGDAFKTRTPNPTYQREFAHRIRDLIQLAPVVMLIGNHDMPASALKASSVEIYQTLEVPGVWVADDYALRLVETRRGPVVVGAAPYPQRSLLLDDTDTAGRTIAEADHLMEAALGQRLRDLAAEADQYPYPRVLTGHFTVSGAAVGSERGIMLGRDVEVMQSDIADPRWDYVALGHIHKHQNLTAGREGVPPVVYAGSMERIDFGEEADFKGFCWAEVTRGACAWTFKRLRARPFVTIQADLRQSTDPTQAIVEQIDATDIDQAIVRVILQLTPETDARLKEDFIREALHRGGAHLIAGIRREVEEPIRARLGASPEGLSDEELLDRYLKTLEVDDPRREHLLAAAREIFGAVAERAIKGG